MPPPRGHVSPTPPLLLCAEPSRDEPRGVAGEGAGRRRWADSDSDDDAPELPWTTRAGTSRHVAFVCRAARGTQPPPRRQQEPDLAVPVHELSVDELMALLESCGDCTWRSLCDDDFCYDDTC